jgi:TPP-dependent pyruvate/acetoin dehydrogenase alpha subunit
MNVATLNTPVARRARLGERTEQLKRMLEIRIVEERIQQLYAQGEVRGSTHLCNGQEAIAVGVARSTRVSDMLTCTYRGHGHALALGVTPEEVIGEICGRNLGCAGGVGGSMHLMGPAVGLLPTFAIVGAGLPVACGVALAARVRRSDDVAIAVFGDGASNIGAFHESLNFASIRALPVVFVCENNLYGEYSRINITTPVADIATRAAGYGIPGTVVDGQDPDAVAAATTEAVARARSGKGPSLLEMKTYRYSGHSRSDPATYRPAGELDAWLQRDPITLFAERLVNERAILPSELERLRESTREEVENAVVHVLAAPVPSQEAMLSHIYGCA